jgi:hypothetical protein
MILSEPIFSNTLQEDPQKHKKIIDFIVGNKIMLFVSCHASSWQAFRLAHFNLLL